MTDDIFLTDPRAKTVEGMIAGLTILATHMEKGMQERYFCGGENYVLHIYVRVGDCPEDSPDGQKLRALGFHTEDDGWAYFT
jgi:hypothetical protein